MPVSSDISVRVLEQGRRAEVRIPAGFDTANLTPDLLRMIAGEAGVQITAEVERRLAAIAASYKSAPPSSDLIADFAHATEPVAGTGGSWEWQTPFDPAGSAEVAAPDAPATTTSTDHYSSQILNVTTGVTVARVNPPTGGADGRTVTGAVIAAKPGPAPAIHAGAGLQVRPDGTVVATCDGVLTVTRGIAAVSAVLEIKGCVDFSTGHIDFKGDVVVADAVRDSFQVRATGAITIHGPVEGATIACNGNLTCPRGIASARRAEITVDGAADLAYLRNAHALFRGDLTCRGEIEHSDVAVGGAVHCEAGRVIGGTLALTGAATIGTLGSPDWTPTTVQLGDLPLVALELRHLTAESARAFKAITAKEEHLRQLTIYGGKTASSREELTIVQYELSELQHAAAEIEAKRAPLQQAMRQSRKAGVQVTNVVYPRVRIQHGESAFEFEQELKGPLQFVLDESGSIFIRVSTLEPRPITEFARTFFLPPAAPAAPEVVKKCA